jgi:hypothetical protein
MLGLLAVAAGCGRGQVFRAGVLAPPVGAPTDIADACELASHRCARCHPLSRIELARIQRPQHWDWYVSRMRLQPRSGIAPQEQPAIVRCLVARSFGLAAAEELPR